MKRLIPLLIVTLFCANGFSQNGFDALIFSETFAGGTARSVSMGGAFGALGADFSSATQNPAGLGFYRKSEMTFSPEFNFNKVKSTYLGNNEEDSKFNINTNNLGFAFSFGDKQKESGFIGWTLGFGFNKLNNYSSNSFAQGINNNFSLADEYAATANYYSTLDSYTDGLFYDAYILDYDDSTGEYYVNPDLYLDGNEQSRSVVKTGKLNEWTIGAGFNISNVFYFGFSMNINPVYYRENTTYSEYDINRPDYLYFSYYDNKKITGSGIGAKLGIIVRPVPMLRIGAAFHTPVVYTLTETDETYIDSYYKSGYLDRFYPYDDFYGEPYEYKVQTPSKLVGSIAATIGNFAVLSSDIEYINYAAMRLDDNGDGYDFSGANHDMADLFKNTINWKMGAEFRFEPFYVRAGFGYYGSPYKANDLNGDSKTLMYSGGFGFRSKSFFIDMAIANSARQDYYIVAPSVSDETIKYTNNTTRVITTVGFRF